MKILVIGSGGRELTDAIAGACLDPNASVSNLAAILCAVGSPASWTPGRTPKARRRAEPATAGRRSVERVRNGGVVDHGALEQRKGLSCARRARAEWNVGKAADKSVGSDANELMSGGAAAAGICPAAAAT